MPAAYGQTVHLGISFQDSYGTSNTDSMHWLEFMSEDLAVKKEAKKSQNMRGIFEEGDAYEGMNSVEGNIESEAHPISLGAMLTAIMGPPTTTIVDSVYEHVFKPRTSDFDDLSANTPFTLYKNMQDGGSAFLMYDLCGNTLELNMANGEFLKSTLGVVGGNFAQVGSMAYSAPAGKRWMWDATSATFDATANTGLSELTVTLNEGIEALHNLAVSRGKWPARLKHTGFRTVEISGTMRFDNQDELQEFLDWNERELIANYRGPTEISSGRYEEVTIKLPSMLYTDFPPSAGGPGLMDVGFTANGNYNTGSGTAIEITLVNTKSGYA